MYYTDFFLSILFYENFHNLIKLLKIINLILLKNYLKDIDIFKFQVIVARAYKTLNIFKKHLKSILLEKLLFKKFFIFQ